MVCPPMFRPPRPIQAIGGVPPLGSVDAATSAHAPTPLAASASPSVAPLTPAPTPAPRQQPPIDTRGAALAAALGQLGEIFPGRDAEALSAVLESHEGNLQLATDRLLAAMEGDATALPPTEAIQPGASMPAPAPPPRRCPSRSGRQTKGRSRSRRGGRRRIIPGRAPQGQDVDEAHSRQAPGGGAAFERARSAGLAAGGYGRAAARGDPARDGAGRGNEGADRAAGLARRFGRLLAAQSLGGVREHREER